MPANTAARQLFANIASTMRKQSALKLQECRLSEPVEPPWGTAYRTIEWSLKSDPRVQRRVVPADCTASELAETLRSHVPGRCYGPSDED
ncbi:MULTISPECIES: DUF2866 domain-containing protein [unclassified Caballeronia]|uniref:DUF2866 domain-containing protein n=1 Tax=unclassified Caballeronia TaxID=2646786 RepID=UPI002864C70C|nr:MULTISPECIES: DUF2866 domain-containing protein [unclassified Caballeronia]MDR5776008.1 DUF2866 domain-containing protein [Caballeronia sp. LZ002]MDR5800916.1 DUF2866 domain-containing protein [Caballeronia sp. LZ001]MDR5851448.1 DUF2866 domain-containing protein [Caballeronia sp. LZ003]